MKQKQQQSSVSNFYINYTNVLSQFSIPVLKLHYNVKVSRKFNSTLIDKHLANGIFMY